MYFESNETEKEIYDIINQEGISIVLCDGGSKKNEFNLLSNLLKKGDIIMAHDYAPNEIFFKQKMINNYWNWLEIQDSDIDFVCKKNNLVPYMNEEFIEVAWVCKIKI
jgi:2-hydroxy-3-keto-5-methylthiopentenyl-1-phosphate phosphatase